MKLAIALVIAMLAAACAKEQKKEDGGQPEPEKPSTAKTAIEGFTGKTAVKQGKKAMKTIEDVSEKKNSDLDEIM